MNERVEHDSLGDVKVPGERYYGAQTARSLANFAIGTERMPIDMIRALALVKKSAALANKSLGLLRVEQANLIVKTADEIIGGEWDAEFPLKVWQTGSGTQTNMNVNEVIANRAAELTRQPMGGHQPLHPNDDVNKSQSSNDVFPSAMHVAAVEALHRDLIPTVTGLRNTLVNKSKAFNKVLKTGRTHLMDAVPLTLGQEFSGYAQQLKAGLERVFATLPRLYEIPLGATAVGTGLNTHPKFAALAVAHIKEFTSKPFVCSRNRFEALAAHDALVELHAALKVLAVSLIKIANDIRWMASGPRCGLTEITIPANEPGSSIMPGKVNPTQAEALVMVATQVMGNDVTVSLAGASGNFELNVCKPVIIYNVLQSIRLLSDACRSFNEKCVAGITPNQNKLDENIRDSLMLATALTPKIGYESAARAVQMAAEQNISLKQAVTELGFLKAEEFDALIRPEHLTKPQLS